METEKIGIREFRENLSGYLERGRPLAITRHGEALGFSYLPTNETKKLKLKPCARQLKNWMR